MGKRTRFLLLILPLIFHFSFSQIFKYKKNSSLFSQGLTGTQSWNLVHTWTVGWCIMCTWVTLLLFIYSFISSVFFLSISKTLIFFITLFCNAYKVETWYTWSKGWSIVYTNYKLPEYTCSFIFLLFLSLQLAEIKNLLLHNCFNMPLMATVGGMWALLTLLYRLVKWHESRGSVTKKQLWSRHTNFCKKVMKIRNSCY